MGVECSHSFRQLTRVVVRHEDGLRCCLGSHGADETSLLYLASRVVLLVRSFFGSVWSIERHRTLLATAPCVVRSVSFRHGHWVPRQLAQKSNFSLRYYCPLVSYRWRPVPAFRCGDSPRQHLLGLALRSHRHRRRVSAGMAVCKAFQATSVNEKPFFRSCSRDAKGAPESWSTSGEAHLKCSVVRLLRLLLQLCRPVEYKGHGLAAFLHVSAIDEESPAICGYVERTSPPPKTIFGDCEKRMGNA